MTVSTCTSTRRPRSRTYAGIHPPRASEDERRIRRQAFAGMMWSKQNYIFDVELWLKGENPKAPPPDWRKQIRNVHWLHLNSMRVLSTAHRCTGGFR